MTDVVDALPEIDRRLHRALLEGMLATGAAPTPEALVAVAGIAAAQVPHRLAALEAADYLSLAPDGVVTCLYPFSPTPTPHAVVVGGRRRYAMCSIDVLGIAAMLGQAVAIEGACGACGESIHLDVAPGTVIRAEPLNTVVVARRSGDEPACETCCPSPLFSCGPAHGAELTTRLPKTIVVPLGEALGHAEAVFSYVLGKALPARRRRSHLTGSPLRT